MMRTRSNMPNASGANMARDETDMRSTLLLSLVAWFISVALQLGLTVITSFYLFFGQNHDFVFIGPPFLVVECMILLAMIFTPSPSLGCTWGGVHWTFISFVGSVKIIFFFRLKKIFTKIQYVISPLKVFSLKPQISASNPKFA